MGQVFRVNKRVKEMGWRLRSALRMAVAAVFFGAMAAHGAMAKVRVIESSVPGIALGAELSETAMLDIPKDAAVIVVQLPECRALELKGPYRGTVAEYLQKQRGFWTRAHDLWDRLAGKGGNTPSIGGTRGSDEACK
jgi:hypothetical protein